MPNRKDPVAMARAATARANAATAELSETTENLTPRLPKI